MDRKDFVGNTYEKMLMNGNQVASIIKVYKNSPQLLSQGLLFTLISFVKVLDWFLVH